MVAILYWLPPEPMLVAAPPRCIHGVARSPSIHAESCVYAFAGETLPIHHLAAAATCI